LPAFLINLKFKINEMKHLVLTLLGVDYELLASEHKSRESVDSILPYLNQPLEIKIEAHTRYVPPNGNYLDWGISVIVGAGRGNTSPYQVSLHTYPERRHAWLDVMGEYDEAKMRGVIYELFRPKEAKVMMLERGETL
jgi:S-adenosylmethionine/arginine decarboxylase-like enzyme